MGPCHGVGFVVTKRLYSAASSGSLALDESDRLAQAR
jgi:hypothetical protein